MEYIDMMTKMMSGSLGLEEPWYISGVEFDEKELALHIYVGIRKGAEIASRLPARYAERRRSATDMSPGSGFGGTGM